MADREPTPSENAILIVLMAEAREIYNSELNKRFHIDVSKESREKLVNRGLLISRRDGNRGYAHELSDKGWVYVAEVLDFNSPKARAIGSALATLLANLRERVLPRTGTNLTEMFSRAKEPVPVPDLERRIRDAYASLAREPGSAVILTRLRAHLSDVPRPELDGALRQLNRVSDVDLRPESNQKALTREDRAAAIRIGGQQRHQLVIGVR